MVKKNWAQWTRTDKGWELLVRLERHWEAPAAGVGKGAGTVIPSVVVTKKNQPDENRTVRLTSNVFMRDSKVLAFAELVED